CRSRGVRRAPRCVRNRMQVRLRWRLSCSRRPRGPWRRRGRRRTDGGTAWIGLYRRRRRQCADGGCTQPGRRWAMRTARLPRVDVDPFGLAVAAALLAGVAGCLRLPALPPVAAAWLVLVAGLVLWWRS